MTIDKRRNDNSDFLINGEKLFNETLILESQGESQRELKR